MFVSNCKILYLTATMDGVWKEYGCAYCGEMNETFIEPQSGAKQSFVEDCAVCCQPNVLTVSVDVSTGAVDVESAMED